MRELKKGQKGSAASYITRTKAVKKLQITLRDFRRLCILKGIYPRDPKKKPAGKNKTYYHKKDIAFLAHEPLLQKFREMKIFLRRRRRAVMRGETARVEVLEKNRPQITVDHLVKERYPTFMDALRDLDDPLTLVSLFALLRGGLEQGFTHEDAELCRRLYREFMLYCARTHSLRKVFVSLKGYYYQASIHGQTITWVMPHQLKQSVPKSVDVRVMLTFLQFYATMLKFVNFRLYHEIGLAYPPPLDAVREQRGEGIGAIVAMAEEEAKRRAAHAATAPVTAARGSAEAAAAAEAKKSAQRELDAAVSRLREKGKAEEDARDAAAPAARSTQDPKQEDSAPNEVPGGEDGNESESEAIGRLFKGLVFVLGREAPLESLEFVVRSAGGETVRADELSPEELKAPRFTHQIVDRPAIDSPIAGRVYVQPQWVFDSFNSRALLPSHPYAPGVVPPPHLSPFVNDYEAGYVPRQRELLEQWGAQPQSRPAGYVADAMESGAREQEAATVKMAGKEEEDEEDEDEDDEKDEEDEERDEDEDEDEADEDDEDEDDEEDDEESDGEDEEDDQAAEPAKAAPAAPRRRERPLSESEEHMQLRKIMMTKKQAYLYSRMQHGIRQKQQANSKLAAKRRKIEELAAASASPSAGKKATKGKRAAAK